MAASMSIGSVGGGMVEQVIADDIESISLQFNQMFAQCVQKVQKPNVLVAGVTGAGKSSLVNAVFGANVAQVGDAVPVTMHFTRIEPPDRPVVIYDSRGLEDGHHEEFIADTRALFNDLRSKQLLQHHIHVVWYVVNAASGRFEPFEEQLVRTVFAPTPVLFVLNKSDVASAQQLTDLSRLLASYQFDCCKGIVRVVADRRNYSQGWCTHCGSDDVMYKNSTRELFCDACERIDVMDRCQGMGQLIETTAQLLPELAKEAFLYSQVQSLQEKDRRAMELVKHYVTNICMDVGGNALADVGEMVGRVFILWGWNYLGYQVSSNLMQEMREEYKGQELRVRLAMIAADTILKRKLSRSVIACLGLMVNRPLRHLSEQLLSMVERNQQLDPANFQLPDARQSDQFADDFMRAAFEMGITAAIDTFWYQG